MEKGEAERRVVPSAQKDWNGLWGCRCGAQNSCTPSSPNQHVPQ